MHAVLSNRLCLLSIVTVFSTSALATVVSDHGRLQVSGNKILDKNNTPITLGGSSLFWSIPGWGGDKYYNANVVDFLKNDWKSTVIRAAMGVEDGGGYIGNPTANKNLVKTVVDACIAKGVYVIIDWHSHYANQNQAQAVAFFDEMSQLYGGYDNVIYEIWNEPKGVTWAGTIKPYANAVIAAIRANDPDNLIVVGTPNWSIDVHTAAADPISDPNVAYTFHFYAATDAYPLSNLQSALNANKAVFVTEWGTCENTGNGSISKQSTMQWMQFLRDNKLSHCNWSINDKAESASALLPGTSAAGGWVDADLTTSGLIVRELVREWDGIFNEAENLTVAASTDTVSTIAETNASAGNVRKINSNAVNDYVSYTVNVPRTGIFKIVLRYKTATTRGKYQLSIDGVNQGSVMDQYSSTVTYLEHNLGLKQFSSTGNKTFKFTVNSKNSSSSGYDLTFDSIRLLDPLGVTWEAEALTVTSSDAMTEHADAACSGGLMDKLNSNQAADYASYTINVAETGTFTIALQAKTYNTRGQFQFSLDGVNLGGVLDQYSATGAIKEFMLGTTTISTTGNHTFKFAVTGKNASSSGYDLTFDCIRLLRH